MSGSPAVIPRHDRAIDPAHNKAAKHYRLKRAIAALMKDAGEENMALNLERCHEYDQQVICLNCATAWYVPEQCRARICPLCSWRVAKQRGAAIVALCKRMKYPKLITLTMPTWTDEPRDGIKHLRKCFQKLRDHKLFEKVTGGAYQIELVPKEHGWHIHIHIIANAPFMPYRSLFAVWRDITGVAAPQVRIQAATTESEQTYASKYCAKSALYEGRSIHAVDWYRATKGSRLFALFGDWYKTSLDTLLANDEEKRPPRLCPHCGAADSVTFTWSLCFVLKDKEVTKQYYERAEAQGPDTMPAAAWATDEEIDAALKEYYDFI